MTDDPDKEQCLDALNNVSLKYFSLVPKPYDIKLSGVKIHAIDVSRYAFRLAYIEKANRLA